MISVTDLRNGTVFQEDDQPWVVLNYEHIKMGRGSANVKLKVRNLRTGHTIEKSYISNARVESADVEKIKVNYLYQDGDNFTFMDSVSFEQYSLPKASFCGGEKFLKDGLEVTLLTWEGQPLSVELPRSLELSVAETGPGVKGDSVSNMQKMATMENGLTMNVPLFINVGDKIKVDIRTGD